MSLGNVDVSYRSPRSLNHIERKASRSGVCGGGGGCVGIRGAGMGKRYESGELAFSQHAPQQPARFGVIPPESRYPFPALLVKNAVGQGLISLSQRDNADVSHG